MTPTEASKDKNEFKVRAAFQYPESKTKHPKFAIGDKVRISRIKDTFEKGYEPNFSYEVFTVKEVLDTQPITYKLVDYFEEPIEGSFYENEMLKTQVPTYYEVEKVLKTRKVGKKIESLVKFVGWPSKFNCYIPEEDIYDLKT